MSETKRRASARAASALGRHRTDPDRPIVWSYGGGTQTAAIAVLVLQGRLPRPHRIVMADTAREATATWDYLADVVEPALAAEGMRVEIASHDLATVDLWGGAASDSLLIPAYTTQKGRTSKLPTFCSNEWKRRPVERYLRAVGYGPKNPVQMWLGMSTDEIERMKASPTPWIDHKYPLCFDVPTSRQECKRLVTAHGWPEPPKSSCWMCPHRSNAQWRDLRDNYPDDFEAACALDEAIRRTDADAFLHGSAVPLREADLEPEASTPGLFSSCDSGYCFV